MNDAGQDVQFLASGQSYAVHRESGMVTKFTRKKNIFEISAEVLLRGQVFSGRLYGVGPVGDSACYVLAPVDEEPGRAAAP